MGRKTITKKTKETLLDEYDHKCAVCGVDRPHIHHIDEDASHNELDNLLPLCPNCHLRDQHNPTRRIDIPKLKLFRKYKDPSILSPQFHPIYCRQLFLDDIEINEDSSTFFERKGKELVEFIAALEMGGFYSKRIEELLKAPSRMFVMSLGGGPDPEYERQRRESNYESRKKMVENKNAVQSLLVELLRYQPWANIKQNKTS